MLLVFFVVLLAIIFASPSVREPFLALLPEHVSDTIVELAGRKHKWGMRAKSKKAVPEGADVFFRVERILREPQKLKDGKESVEIIDGTPVRIQLKIMDFRKPTEIYYNSRGDPDAQKLGGLQFVAGRQEVIPAVDRAVKGMRQGERRMYAASPEQCYGARGFMPWGIDPYTPLRLDIEIMHVGPEDAVLAEPVLAKDDGGDDVVSSEE